MTDIDVLYAEQLVLNKPICLNCSYLLKVC